ncbi:MAG: hypothetical protein J2P36_34800, partial [Ktedonobacteraceae bacterium]|nr:hypothetical protein [Ktedonobacteraceae bacterium]
RIGKAHVVPVQARPYDYAATPLDGLQFLPRKKPLSRMLNRDEGHVEIAEGVRQIILTLHNPRKKENSLLDIPDEQFPEVLTLDPMAAISISDSSLFLKKGDILFKHQHYD